VTLHTVARQRLGENVAAATNTHAAIGVFLVAFSVVSRKVGDQFFQELIVYLKAL
jgi:hypothetical protein